MTLVDYSQNSTRFIRSTLKGIGRSLQIRKAFLVGGKNLALLFLAGFLTINLYSQTTSPFTSNGTFIVPAGVTSILVECVGAGGGGSSLTANNARGGGGGGGAFASSVLSVIPGTSYSVVVGSGGLANTSGGSSSFGSNLVLAAGGTGGVNNNSTAGAGGTIAASIGTTRYPGGNGANGGTTYSGGGGGGAGTTGAGGNAPTAAAGTFGTGTSLYGGHGGISVTGSLNGNPGNTYGGGGSGSVTNSNTSRTGGSGAGGYVIITYTCPVYNIQSISVTGAICAGNSSTVTVNSTATDLPVGRYTVTYNQGAPNAGTGLTATMIVTIAGSGSFSTGNLNNAGSTTITITSLSSGNCNSAVSATNNISVNSSPSAAGSISGTTSICQGQTSVSYSVPVITNAANYVWSYSGTGATISGNTQTITIDFSATATSGNLTVFGTNGTCNGAVSANYAITVKQNATLTLTSDPATSNQTTCISSAISSITYLVGGSGTGAGVTGLPSGITGTYSSGTKIFTISGTPSVSGTFTYTVTTTGPGCNISSQGTIYVTAAVAAGTLNAVRNGGRCGVQIDGSPVTCPDGSAATYIWYFRRQNNDPDSVVIGENGEDLFPTGDASRMRYSRVAVCGSCQSPPVDLRSPISAYMSVTATGTNVTCFGYNDGTATAAITGGFPPFTYNWNPTAQSTSTATNLAPGTYNVVVKDYYNCNTNSNVTITGPASALTASITSTTNIECFGAATGSLTITASGGWGNYTYSINGGTTYQGSNIFTGLIAGNYTATVKDGNGCIVTTQQITLIQPSAPITANYVFTNVTCFGANDGTISITNPAGGYGTYQYSINGTTWQSSASFINLSNGTYNVQIRDAAHISCITVLNSNVVLTQPAALAITILSANQELCYNTTSAILSASPATGGTGPSYNYQWQSSSDGITWTPVSGATSLTYTPPSLTTTFFRIAATDGGTPSCGTVYSSSVQIKVNPLPITSPIYHR